MKRNTRPTSPKTRKVDNIFLESVEVIGKIQKEAESYRIRI
jgi:hypothetical protein